MDNYRLPSDEPDNFDRLIYRAMADMKWITPIDDDTLEKDEQAFQAALQSGKIHLPKTLESPDAILAKFHAKKSPTPSPEQTIGEQMARAAREGGAIPPDVEEQMRRDRKNAEAKLQKPQGYDRLFD
jgi:hypothetical protein